MGRTVAAPGLAVTEHELAEILTLPAFALHAREGGRGMQPKRGSLNTPPMSCGGPRGLPVRREAARARTADFAIRHTKGPTQAGLRVFRRGLCSRAAVYCSQSPPGRITRLIVSTLRSSMMTGAAGATRGATIAWAGGKPGATKVVSLIRR